ncbi:MAG TPA: TolC family protein [Chryseosolibacter sp.]
MNKLNLRYALILLIYLCTFSASAQQQSLTIEDVILRAKAQSPFSKQAETRKENRFWAYRSYKTNFNPQLVLVGMLPTYAKSVNAIPQPDGTYKYIPVEQTFNNVRLGLVQPIFMTGATISANTSLNYFKDFRTAEAAEQWSGSVMNVELEQPLFAFNPLKWERKIQPLIYEESKREYVEQMEFISEQSALRFFNVLQEQIKLQIATFNLANNDTIYKIEQGRYNIGTTSQDKLLQVELQLLRSRQAVGQANLDLETARLELRTYLGLRDNDAFPELILPESIPMFDVSMEEAIDHAKKNRAQFISFERQRLQAERDLARARGNRFQTSVSAAYGLNNNGVVLNDVYQDPLEQQQVSVTFSIPVLNWGRNKAMMKSAIANKKLTDYIIEQDEVTFEQDIMTLVRQFELLRMQIDITKKADEVAAQRYNVAQNRYLIGKIDITNLNIALEEKDNAKMSYIEALKSFWTSYYQLRRLTLYDFASKTLLYVETPE